MFLFAWLTGLTVAGCVSAMAEAVSARAVTFWPPFVSRARILRSLAFTALAGPAMILNDAMDAWRTGGISAWTLGAAVMVVNAWALALGILSLALLAAVFPAGV
ncbi:DUF6949 family protein [Zhengella sp. ZM62]|uniref:DUF6949 family protein n=1 Tax=Zhengella sedimenti TaxID=3390035 RepID=UPI00397627D0